MSSYLAQDRLRRHAVEVQIITFLLQFCKQSKHGYLLFVQLSIKCLQIYCVSMCVWVYVCMYECVCIYPAFWIDAKAGSGCRFWNAPPSATRFHIFKSFNPDFTPYNFLRITFTQFRLSSHNMQRVETGRWSRTPREEGVCCCGQGIQNPPYPLSTMSANRCSRDCRSGLVFIRNICAISRSK